MDATSPTFILAERIAAAELKIGLDENRVRNPDAFRRKVRDNLLERTSQRGTAWLIEQARRFGAEIPDELEPYAEQIPTTDRLPVLCATCGVCIRRGARPIETVVIDGWPVSVALCVRGYNVSDCYEYQERGTDPGWQALRETANTAVGR